VVTDEIAPMLPLTLSPEECPEERPGLDALSFSLELAVSGDTSSSTLNDLISFPPKELLWFSSWETRSDGTSAEPGGHWEERESSVQSFEVEAGLADEDNEPDSVGCGADIWGVVDVEVVAVGNVVGAFAGTADFVGTTAFDVDDVAAVGAALGAGSLEAEMGFVDAPSFDGDFEEEEEEEEEETFFDGDVEEVASFDEDFEEVTSFEGDGKEEVAEVADIIAFEVGGCV